MKSCRALKVNNMSATDTGISFHYKARVNLPGYQSAWIADPSPSGVIDIIAEQECRNGIFMLAMHDAEETGTSVKIVLDVRPYMRVKGR